MFLNPLAPEQDNLVKVGLVNFNAAVGSEQKVHVCISKVKEGDPWLNRRSVWYNMLRLNL